MFVSAFTRHIPDYGDATTNQAETMIGAIKRLIKKHFSEISPGDNDKCVQNNKGNNYVKGIR